MGAVGYRFRAELRTRWLAWLGLAALVGVVAGSVLVFVAGTRRTSSAYDRFLVAQNAYDIGVFGQCGGEESQEAPPDPRCIDRLTRLPAVELGTVVSEFHAYAETSGGVSLQPNDDPCYSGPGTVRVIADPAGKYGTSLNRFRYVAGGPADPRAKDQAVISQDTARARHLDIGSVVRLSMFDGDHCLDSRSTWRPPITVRVVGIELSPGEVRPPSGDYFQFVTVTPAFVEAIESPRDRGYYAIVKLRSGATPEHLEKQARKAGIAVESAIDQAENTEAVARAIRPMSVSLALLAALTAIAGAVVIGQVLVRQATLESGDTPILAALGLDRSGRLRVALLRGAFVGFMGSIAAAAVALGASTFMPVGLSRRVDPNRGISVDGRVIAIGMLCTVVFVVAMFAASTLLRMGERRSTNRDSRRRRAVAADAAARAGLSPATVSGIRFALERGSGAGAVPVVTSFAGVTIAVAAIVGALTFGSGLTHLLDTPRLVGWNWDVGIGYPEQDDTTAAAAAARRADIALEKDPRIAEFARGSFWPPFPQGRPLQLGRNHLSVQAFQTFDGNRAIGPSVITGRKPTAPDEILLGPDTLRDLGLSIGDSLVAYGQAGTWEAPGKETSTRVRIVGTGVLPMTDRLGRGASMTLAGLAPLNPETTAGGVFVRLAPGADPQAVVEAMRNAFPDAPDEAFELFSFGQFQGLVLNLEQIDFVPVLFAVLMGLMAIAVLAHVLVTSTRAHRRDRAVLRALGFSRSQLLWTVACQSIVYTLGALLVGVPLGVAIGRYAWRLYAENLGVVPEPITEWPLLLFTALAALTIAVLTSVVSGWRPTKARPAPALRDE